jgi:hypothetical protein
MTRKSVQGGYCNWPDTAGCALTKFECDDPSNFLSARQMQSGPIRAHGGSCRWQDSVKETYLGKCTTEDGVPTQCATEVEACPENDATRGFLEREYDCTVETTSFGRCDYGMCAWSHKHCCQDNTWEAFDEACTCDKVQVGACSRYIDGARESYCAVSEDACDDEQTWIAPQEVMQSSGFDCFLCREESLPNTPPSVGVVTTDENNFSAVAGKNSQTTIMVVVAAGAVLALSIVGLVGWKAFRTKRAAKRAGNGVFAKEEAAPPAMAIQISQGDGKDCTDMDNASVLSDE